jgi:hypothetical protein
VPASMPRVKNSASDARLGWLGRWMNCGYGSASSRRRLACSLPVALCCLLLLSIASARAGAAKPVDVPAPLWRTNLMAFHKPDGSMAPIKKKADWQRRRTEILRGVIEVTGTLPGPERWCPFDMRTLEKTNCGSFARMLISYASEPGCRTPAYLLVPNAALESLKPLPAILALHPDDAKYGFRAVVDPVRDDCPPYGRELAERGYVVIAPAYPLTASYQPDLKALGYRSGTIKAVHDDLRALDLLETLPFVRKGRFGAIGHGLGGHNALFSAAFDRRLCAVVCSCGFDSFLDYHHGDPAYWQPGKGWCQDRYMPNLVQYQGRLPDIPFDFYELVACLAPRPLYVSAPFRDPEFNQRSVDNILTAVAGIYRLFHVPGVLQAAYPSGGADFPTDARDAAYDFLDQYLSEGHAPGVKQGK